MAERRIAKARIAMLGAAIAVMAISVSPAQATVYNPPWADGMWAHFPGQGGLDTTHTINLAEDYFDQLGYNGFSSNPGSVPLTMGNAYAQSDAIWWMAGHGEAGMIQSYSGTTWGTLYASSTSPGATCGAPNDCMTDYTSTQMHRIRLMVFQGCFTALPSGSNARLTKKAYDVWGVDSSVGFNDEIFFTNFSDHWSEFVLLHAASNNLTDSLSMAASDLFAGGAQTWGYGNYSVYGGGVHLTPKAYGT